MSDGPRLTALRFTVRISGYLWQTHFWEEWKRRGDTYDDDCETAPGAEEAGGAARRAAGASAGLAGQLRALRSLLRARRPQVRSTAGGHPGRPGSGVGADVQGTAAPGRPRGPRRHHDRASGRGIGAPH